MYTSHVLQEHRNAHKTKSRRYPYAWHKFLPGLHHARKAADVSVRDLARESGVATATVHELERLKRTAKPATRQALARALRVRVRDLTTPPQEANVDT